MVSKFIKVVLPLLSMPLLLGLLFGPAQATTGPDELIKTTAEQLVNALQAEGDRLKEQPERSYGLVEEIILPHVDARRISQWVLGTHWRTASPEQRQRFSDEFRTFLIRTYANAMVEFLDKVLEHADAVHYAPLRLSPGEETVTVRTEIRRVDGGPPIPVHYHMHRSGEDWKIYDVSIDGVSLVTTYRSSFASRIRRDGMESLIEELALRNQQALQSVR